MHFAASMRALHPTVHCRSMAVGTQRQCLRHSLQLAPSHQQLHQDLVGQLVNQSRRSSFTVQAQASWLDQLSSTSRAVVSGTCPQHILSSLKTAGVQDMLLVVNGAHAPADAQLAQSLVGNDLGTRMWQGNLLELPAYMSSADVVVVGTEAQDLRALLMKASVFILRPGGYALICLPQGPSMTAVEVCKLTYDMPLELPPGSLPGTAQGTEVVMMQVPPLYALKRDFGPVPVLQGPVIRGFGRGSRQMGTPTANIDPSGLAEQLAVLPKGVYFGWACLEAPEGWHADDSAVHKVVLNIGTRPTVSDGGSDVSVECFILYTFSGPSSIQSARSGTDVAEFYGSKLKVAVTGFLRPEMRFPGLPALVSRIKMDTALARNMLDTPEHAQLKKLVQ